jgi:hypothetical protein
MWANVGTNVAPEFLRAFVVIVSVLIDGRAPLRGPPGSTEIRRS